jgi:hypothetical protein
MSAFGLQYENPMTSCSDHFDGTRFFDPMGTPKSLCEVLRWCLAPAGSGRPGRTAEPSRRPPPPPRVSEYGMIIVRQPRQLADPDFGLNILIDPGGRRARR